MPQDAMGSSVGEGAIRPNRAMRRLRVATTATASALSIAALPVAAGAPAAELDSSSTAPSPSITYVNGPGVTGTPIPRPPNLAAPLPSGVHVTIEVLGTFGSVHPAATRASFIKARSGNGLAPDAVLLASGGTHNCDFDGVVEYIQDIAIDWGGSVTCSDEMAYSSITGTLYNATGNDGNYQSIQGPVEDAQYSAHDVATPTEIWSCGTDCTGNAYKAHFHAEVDEFFSRPPFSSSSGDCTIDSNSEWAAQCDGWTAPLVPTS